MYIETILNQLQNNLTRFNLNPTLYLRYGNSEPKPGVIHFMETIEEFGEEILYDLYPDVNIYFQDNGALVDYQTALYTLDRVNWYPIAQLFVDIYIRDLTPAPTISSQTGRRGRSRSQSPDSRRIK